MNTLKIATLIQALDLIGQIYRSKDGSQPADAVQKVLQQLQGAADLTLAEWLEAKQSRPKRAARQAAKANDGDRDLGQALMILEQAGTHAALAATVGSLGLSVGEWQALAKMLTGRSARSGKAARETVETHFSDRLLLNERVEGVKQQFRSTTTPRPVV